MDLQMKTNVFSSGTREINEMLESTKWAGTTKKLFTTRVVVQYDFSESSVVHLAFFSLSHKNFP